MTERLSIQFESSFFLSQGGKTKTAMVTGQSRDHEDKDRQSAAQCGGGGTSEPVRQVVQSCSYSDYGTRKVTSGYTSLYKKTCEQKIETFHQLSSVQSLSHVQLFTTQIIAACQASLSIINSQNSPKLMSIEQVMPSSHPQSSPSPPAHNPSQHQSLFQ